MTFNEFLSNYGLFIALTIFSVIIVLVLFFLFIPRLKKEEKVEEHSVNKEHFISLLGGNENILEVTLRGSRLTVSLKDPSLARTKKTRRGPCYCDAI